MELLFVFVEGPDDERFINGIFGKNNIKIIKYAVEKKEYINNYIRSVKSMPNCDYVIIGDIDLKSLDEKKREILLQFPACETDKIIVSIAEVESWYFAGLDEESAKRIKVKYTHNTEGITKERFEMLIPQKIGRINFMIEILKKYNIDEAILRNNSLKFLVDYFVTKKKMAVSRL